MKTFKKFRREFSANLYKSLKYPLGEVSLAKDWVNDTRGDPYPLIYKSDGITEQLVGGVYKVENLGCETSELRRFAFGFFPYASYCLNLSKLTGEAGFTFRCRESSLYCQIGVRSSDKGCELVFRPSPKSDGEAINVKEVPSKVIFTCRPGAVDIYFDGKVPKLIKTFEHPEFSAMLNEKNFSVSNAEFYAKLPAGGVFETDGICSYLDCGISQADIRPIRYEDGTPMTENGRIHFTMSARLEAGAYQAVISWLPTSSELRLEGAIFFNTGDGIWANDVASSVIFDRNSEKWLIWYCSFSHGHILAHGESYADLRHGINIIDSVLMKPQSEIFEKASKSDIALGLTGKELSRAVLDNDKLFFAKYGDEDPDFIFDASRSCWLMTICRVVEENGKRPYRYFLFKSDSPFDGYEYVTHSDIGENTGGSIVKTEDGYAFACGSDFSSRSRYYVFDINDFTKHEKLEHDYDDGGFRGWGTLMLLPCGSRRIWYHITFDRHNGSAYNWSYGNIYVFRESI